MTHWKADTLKDYMDIRFAAYDTLMIAHAAADDAAVQALDTAIHASIAAAAAATLKAEEAINKRFDQLNEMRNMVIDQQKVNMPRAESLLMHAGTEERLARLVVEIGQLREGQIEIRGRRLGNSEVIAYVIALLAVAASIASRYIK